jgi:hypothetical protein
VDVLNRTPYEAGVIREFVTKTDQVYYRVFSGDNSVGGFVTAVKPKNSAYAREVPVQKRHFLAAPQWLLPGNRLNNLPDAVCNNGCSSQSFAIDQLSA